jgi:hypothetical protein
LLLAVGAVACDEGNDAQLDAGTSPIQGGSTAGTGMAGGGALSGNGTAGGSGGALGAGSGAISGGAAGGQPGAGGLAGAGGLTGAAGGGNTADGGGAHDAGIGSSVGDGGSADAGSASAGACTRDGLRALVDQYFTAFAAHDSSMLPLSPTAKYTENGATVKIGEGAWKTAGAVKFKRTLVDTTICTSVTESVIDNTWSGGSGGGGGGFLGGLFGGGGGSSSGAGDAGSSTAAGRADFVYGLRLKVDGGKIAEVETILVSPADWVANPPAVIASGKDDWETPLPDGKRPTRDELKKIVDDYFDLFATGDVSSFPFASDCARLENGTSPGACNAGISAFGGMKARLSVIDVEASVAIGFVMFAGTFDDFHMFKVRDKEVHGVHAVLVQAGSKSGWD